MEGRAQVVSPTGGKTMAYADNEEQHGVDNGAPAGDVTSNGGKPPKKGGATKVILFLVAVGVMAGAMFVMAMKDKPTRIGEGGCPSPAGKKGMTVNSSKQEGGCGAPLAGIKELTAVAADMDTVFILVPTKDNAPFPQESIAVVNAVEKTLNGKGVSTGVYTLQTTSPDHAKIAAKLALPGIAVLTKTKHSGYVSGTITEATLMQAYITSSVGKNLSPKSGSAKPGM